MKETIMIAESFDSPTLANMEVALERACKSLSIGAEDHRVRRHIANKILKCAEGRNRTLGSLTPPDVLRRLNSVQRMAIE
jgi:hypothetical protein